MRASDRNPRLHRSAASRSDSAVRRILCALPDSFRQPPPTATDHELLSVVAARLTGVGYVYVRAAIASPVPPR
jgi:hypothetical protein